MTRFQTLRTFNATSSSHSGADKRKFCEESTILTKCADIYNYEYQIGRHL